MKRFMPLATLLIALFAMTVITAAQDEPITTEDPTENACYVGGMLEGKCDWPTDAEDEWAWNCGWHLASVLSRRSTVEQFPADCGFFAELYACAIIRVPDELVDEIEFAGFSGLDFRLIGPLNTADNAEFFLTSNQTCVGSLTQFVLDNLDTEMLTPEELEALETVLDILTFTILAAPDEMTAFGMCESLYGTEFIVAIPASEIGALGVESDWYLCFDVSALEKWV
ncbi:MAG: hypothetical protein MUF38_07315 [Anaerolineae bacterium]|jgi:hypothetical protein|nr:hypothetical protein [Anaerolineae bacterium]